MNIMLATVTERTREIGIRRAPRRPAPRHHVQFLIETVVLSAAGGLIGVALGLLMPFVFGKLQGFINDYLIRQAGEVSDFGKMFSQMQPQIAMWSLPLAFGVSVAIGVIFGVYPARSAARLDPIEAIPPRVAGSRGVERPSGLHHVPWACAAPLPAV